MKRVYTLFSLLFSFVLPLLASTETAIPVDRLYTLTPDEFKTLEIIDVDGNQVKDFRTQRTMDARIDEFLGLYVRFNNRVFYYVARPIGGKPIKFISWQDNSVNGKRIMQLNGRTVSEYLRDEQNLKAVQESNKPFIEAWRRTIRENKTAYGSSSTSPLAKADAMSLFTKWSVKNGVSATYISK